MGGMWHVAHMEEKRNAYKFFRWNAEKNKSLQRQNRWVDIQMDL